jgi:hypothetical protein
MGYKRKILVSLVLLVAAFLSTGCIDKTFKPEVSLEIPSVIPYELYATATDTASLPTTTITVTSISPIPCNLKSYSISYFTKYGDSIPGLSVNSTPVELKLEGEGTVDVTVKPYTSQVVDLFELSGSDISPVTAKINLVFKDYNDNMVSKEAHCLLYKPD